MEEPIAREVEGVDLDLDLLARMNEADVSVRNHRLDLKMAVGWRDDEQRLRRRHNAADRMHRKLLDHAVDRRWSGAAVGPLLRLDQILAQPSGLSLSLNQLARKRAPILRVGLRRACR